MQTDLGLFIQCEEYVCIHFITKFDSVRVSHNFPRAARNWYQILSV